MKLIRFVPSTGINSSVGVPQPAKNFVPGWWKKGELELSTGDPGMKACIPFLDVLISGYMLVTPFDIFVTKNEDGTQNIRWNAPDGWEGFIGERPVELGSTIPRPAGHSPNGMVWSSKWGWKTPRGWSTIVTHPYNHHDLPFTTLSAYMDSDKYYNYGNIPFFIKEDFEGRIVAGTPFAQVIPVKRASWKSMIDFGLSNTAIRQGSITRDNEHFYKKFLWVKKVYR